MADIYGLNVQPIGWPALRFPNMRQRYISAGVAIPSNTSNLSEDSVKSISLNWEQMNKFDLESSNGNIYLEKFFEFYHDFENNLFYDTLGEISSYYLLGRYFQLNYLSSENTRSQESKKKCLRAYAFGRFISNMDIGPINRLP
jgi:hypothetical protein